MTVSGIELHFVVCCSTPLVQGDHGNHHVNLKQEKVTSSVKVHCITMSCFIFVNKVITGSVHYFVVLCPD